VTGRPDDAAPSGPPDADDVVLAAARRGTPPSVDGGFDERFVEPLVEHDDDDFGVDPDDDLDAFPGGS